MAVITRPAAPETQADIDRLVKHGVRDIRTAAEFLACGRSEVWALIRTGAIWSFRRGGKRLVPLVELRRYLGAVAMESIT